MTQSQSLMEWATKVNTWARGLVKQLLVPAALASVATAILSGFLIMALTFNTMIDSQGEIIEALRTENKLVLEKSAGLLEETLLRVDTLQSTIELGRDQTSYEVTFSDAIRLQGSQINFTFYKHRVSESRLDTIKTIVVEYENFVDGIIMSEKGQPADKPLDRLWAVSFSLDLGKGRFEFTALGRRYYMYCERLSDSQLDLVVTIMALDPIYKPTLGL